MTTVPIAELARMNETERAHALNALTTSAVDLNAEIAVVAAHLRAFEERYEISSADVHTAIRAGTLRETTDVSTWLFWIAVRNQLAG